VSETPSISQSGPTLIRPSRSSPGRISGAVARILGGTSTVQATGRFLRRQLWAWPVIAAVLFGGAGWWVHRSVENAMRDQRATDLTTMIDASANAVRVWMGEQRVNVELIAADEKLWPMVAELLHLADGTPTAERQLIQAKAQELLRARLRPRLQITGYVGYVVVSPAGVVVAADQDAPIGKVFTGYRKEIADQAIQGKSMVTRPFRSMFLLPDEKGELRANLPTMFTVGPLRDEAGKPGAALGLRIRPEDQFTRILQVVRFGQSGEAYAFDRGGLLLSQSRFDDELKQIGLLVDQPDARSILTVEIRDPQVNMHQGERPPLHRADQPLTRLAAEAVQGRDGHDADGYRDYRGVPSVGAWRWLPEYDFGIAAEVDTAEAFGPVYILRRAFWTLMVLLVLCAVGIFLAMLYIARQQRALQRATLAARQLGQYTLEETLGSGGMGTVYKARHAMLRRPTAVKLLDGDKMSEAAIARFEREVQLTGALTHPNTVAVYDYGRTPDGIFYYAMEYLEGMNLEDLVTRAGPLPEARAMFILRQACGALAEAHTAGLVHRDVKPANIILTRRGGLCDFVKVLDFGLAKVLGGGDSAGVTSPNVLMGTPLYLSPEGVNHPEQVDARSDVYALGAVGYILLTGTPVFGGASVLEICMKHVQAIPEPPSARLGRAVSAGLEKLLLRCLSKSPSERPRDAAELLRELEACSVEGEWTAQDAAAWWANFTREVRPNEQATRKQEHPTHDRRTPDPAATMGYQGGTESVQDRK
jgi:eukaryotic-like serine/threonine-protein kinase